MLNIFEINYSQLIQYEILEKLVTCIPQPRSSLVNMFVYLFLLLLLIFYSSFIGFCNFFLDFSLFCILCNQGVNFTMVLR